MQYDSSEEWWKQVNAYEGGWYPVPDAKPHPGYRKMWDWQVAVKKCFRTLEDLQQAYKLATGIEVDIAL
jgi:hypothetical protein